jgi:photosynthetic reaction center H subunit
MREPLLASKDLENLPVYDAAQIPIGVTFGVLTEADTGLVRFFDVSIEGRQRHVLVPVGHTRLERHLDKLRLRLRAATVDELERIPAYEPHIAWHDDVYQNKLLTAFGRLFEGQRYYAHPAFDHAGLYAGAHPLLRDPLSPASPEGLRRISASPEFKVVDGEPDIRSWTLLGDAGQQIGVVTDLIIDAAAEEVRYVVVRRGADEKETLLPIGYVDLGKDTVHVPLAADDTSALPEFTGDMLERKDEAELRTVLDSILSGSRRYLRPDFKSAA